LFLEGQLGHVYSLADNCVLVNARADVCDYLKGWCNSAAAFFRERIIDDFSPRSPPNPGQQLHPKNRTQSKKQQAGPRTGAGAGRRTLSSEYLGAGAMVVGRVSYC
jgi:hypothetical protein